MKFFEKCVDFMAVCGIGATAFLMLKHFALLTYSEITWAEWRAAFVVCFFVLMVVMSLDAAWRGLIRGVRRMRGLE